MRINENTPLWETVLWEPIILLGKVCFINNIVELFYIKIIWSSFFLLLSPSSYLMALKQSNSNTMILLSAGLTSPPKQTLLWRGALCHEQKRKKCRSESFSDNIHPEDGLSFLCWKQEELYNPAITKDRNYFRELKENDMEKFYPICSVQICAIAIGTAIVRSEVLNIQLMDSE